MFDTLLVRRQADVNDVVMKKNRMTLLWGSVTIVLVVLFEKSSLSTCHANWEVLNIDIGTFADHRCLIYNCKCTYVIGHASV